MNGKSRNAANWPIQMNQTMIKGTILVSHNDASSNGQIAIKPRMPQTSAVRGHTELQKAFLLNLGLGLYFQARRISVRSDNVEPVAHFVLFAHCKGYHRRVVARKVVLATSLELGPPVVLFTNQLKAFAVQPRLARSDCMKG